MKTTLRVPVVVAKPRHPIPPVQRQRDRKNDYQRAPKHRTRSPENV